MSELLCPYCGTSNPSEAEFCKACFRSLTDTPNLPFEQASSNDELPDWLSSLRSETNGSSQVEEPGSNDQIPDEQENSEEIPDWLQRIRQRSKEEIGEKEEYNPENDEDLPDWLKEMHTSETSPEPSSTEAAEQENWFNQFQSNELPKSPTPTNNEDNEWLKSLENWGAGISPEQPFIQEPEELSQTAEWPKAEETENSISGESEDDNEWLKSLGLFAEIPEDQPTAQPIEPAHENDLVDWASFEQSSQEKSPIDDSTSQEAFPSWFDQANVHQDTNTEFETPTEAETPDWLSQFKEPAAQSAQPFDESSSEIPDWMAGLETPTNEEPAAQEETPGWLNFSAQEEKEILESAESIPGWLSGQAEIAQDEPETIGQPEFTTQFSPTEDQPMEAGEEITSPFGESEFSAWLSEIGEEPAETPKQAETQPESTEAFVSEIPNQPFDEALLPDWFAEGKEEIPESQVPETVDSSLELAQLPGWLQAMRPVESAAPGRVGTDSDERIERSGPLSGYQGVVPGENLVTRYAKPPVYTAKLQINEKQRIYAGLLENLISNETRGVSIREEDRSVPSVFGRMLIGLLVVILIGVLVFGGAQQMPLPNLFPTETFKFFETLNQLQGADGGSPRVLLAVDYEASLAGELKTISQPVVAQLMAKNAKFALISTTPAGPILGNQLLEETKLYQTSYLINENVVNLGYLPGGATGLALLAANPQNAAPATFESRPAWNSPILANINQINDFDAVIVLTNEAETGRAWIEQVGTSLEGTPLLVIASAQAGPILQPYAAAGQIQGLLAGLSGSAAYQSISQSIVGETRLYWDSYQLGMLVFAGLILFGGVFQGVRSLLNNKRTAKKA